MRTKLRQWRQGLKRRLVVSPNSQYWSQTAIELPELTHLAIADRIEQSIPTCVARIGSIESQVAIQTYGYNFLKIAQGL
jgi:hypothetical protein